MSDSGEPSEDPSKTPAGRDVSPIDQPASVDDSAPLPAERLDATADGSPPSEAVGPVVEPPPIPDSPKGRPKRTTKEVDRLGNFVPPKKSPASLPPKKSPPSPPRKTRSKSVVAKEKSGAKEVLRRKTEAAPKTKPKKSASVAPSKPMAAKKSIPEEDLSAKTGGPEKLSASKMKNIKKKDYVAQTEAFVNKHAICALCHGFLRHARMILECGHIFCRDCIENLMDFDAPPVHSPLAPRPASPSRAPDAETFLDAIGAELAGRTGPPSPISALPSYEETATPRHSPSPALSAAAATAEPAAPAKDATSAPAPSPATSSRSEDPTVATSLASSSSLVLPVPPSFFTVPPGSARSLPAAPLPAAPAPAPPPAAATSDPPAASLSWPPSRDNSEAGGDSRSSSPDSDLEPRSVVRINVPSSELPLERMKNPAHILWLKKREAPGPIASTAPTVPFTPAPATADATADATEVVTSASEDSSAERLAVTPPPEDKDDDNIDGEPVRSCPACVGRFIPILYDTPIRPPRFTLITIRQAFEAAALIYADPTAAGIDGDVGEGSSRLRPPYPHWRADTPSTLDGEGDGAGAGPSRKRKSSPPPDDDDDAEDDSKSEDEVVDRKGKGKADQNPGDKKRRRKG